MSKIFLPYAMLGVGLAIVFTFGLSGITSVVEQKIQESTEPQPSLKAGESVELSMKASIVESENYTAVLEAEESKDLSREVPSFETPFTVSMPYLVAALVGTLVFIIARKHII